jgi:hypothetical protein
LDAAYLLLLKLIKRAHTLSQVYAMRSDLDDIRLELVKTAAQPIDATTANTPPNPT